MIDRFLSAADVERATDTLRRLARHNIECWALTGGLAVEMHRWRRGPQSGGRVLNDLDFVAAGFPSIPESLAEDFLFRHVHPAEEPGRILLQFVDPAPALRVDVFRASEGTLNRAEAIDLQSGPVRVVSVEDLLARTGRLLLDLAEGIPVPAKYAADYARLLALTDETRVEAAWRDHRKAHHPGTFCEARSVLQKLIADRSELLIAPQYCQDPRQVCRRCRPVQSFPLADPRVVLWLLGYC